MKASDYIVEFLVRKGITDVFGYPGGMVTHLMDSLAKYRGQIAAHLTYHEQGAAFAACGYAQASGKPGVAYATSGPGATNLVTGIANAYFDSIPALFITGQVNSNETKGSLGVRQRGFQETDIVSIVKPVTKSSMYVENAQDLPTCLQEAFDIAATGRKGPVLLDIPMNVTRADIKPIFPEEPGHKALGDVDETVRILEEALSESLSPVVLVGNGVKQSGYSREIRRFVERLGIPSVTSMIAFDALGNTPLNYGFIGAYGNRTANFIAAKCDLVISIGSRLDIRQVGVNRNDFAPNAKVIRFDVDCGEMEYRVHQNETQIIADMSVVAEAAGRVNVNKKYNEWIAVCDEIRGTLANVDSTLTGKLVADISRKIPAEAVITTDVGQNQVWVAQSFQVKDGQQILFSGGHGAMGYSLPAAIGAYYGSGRKPVVCITGDGGAQMNIQELQVIARENIPIKIIVLNNNALGMIRHFQEMYFNGRYFQTKPKGGYTAPNFKRIADAYGIESQQVTSSGEIGDLFDSNEPKLFEVLISGDTYVTPKLEFGKPNQDQEPALDRKTYNRLMNLKQSKIQRGGGV